MFGKLLTNQKIAHKIVKPYVYKALREGLKLMTTVKYKISEGSIPSLSASSDIESWQNPENQRIFRVFCFLRLAKKRRFWHFNNAKS